MLTTKRPLESPGDHDPISRLVAVLEREGFHPVHEDDEWSGFGEKVWHRAEKVLFAEGETVVIVIEHPDVDETILDQAMRGMRELFRARSRTRQALSVLQTTTVYVCISGSAGMPYHGKLTEFVSVAGGAVILPVVVIADHNTVIYPDVSGERKISPIRRRVEYLQYLLGEVREPVEIHRPTIRTFWISVGFAAALVVAAILTAIF